MWINFKHGEPTRSTFGYLQTWYSNHKPNHAIHNADFSLITNLQYIK